MFTLLVIKHNIFGAIIAIAFTVVSTNFRSGSKNYTGEIVVLAAAGPTLISMLAKKYNI